MKPLRPAKSETSSKIAAAVFLTALAVFAGTLVFDHVWDDPYLLERVRNALSQGEVGSLFSTSFYVKTLSSARYYRPVMLATLLGEVSLTGGAPWFSHLVNVLLHAVNAALVFFLLKRILRQDLGAAVGAFLFAVLPVHAEAVAVLSSRMDLMTLTLLLPAAIWWTHAAGDRNEVSLLSRILAVVTFLLACLTKETALMLPVVLLSWEILRRNQTGRGSSSALLSVILASLGVLFIRWAVFAHESASGVAETAKAGALASPEALPRILKVLLIHMRMAVLPFPSRFQWALTDLTLGWTTILAALCFAVLIAWSLWRRSPGAVQGLLWWSIFTLPVLGFFNLGHVAAAERYAYIPSVGLVMIVGGLAASVTDAFPHRRLAGSLVLAVIVTLGTGAALHSGVYRKEITLFKAVVDDNPRFAVIHLNLGTALAREGRYEEALQSYDRAAALVPGWPDAAFNRGNLFYRTGRFADAVAEYDSVLVQEPDDWETYLNRGNALAALGRTEEAARSYQRASDLNTTTGRPLVGLGVLAARGGAFARAALLFAEAAEREPGLSEAFEGLGETYLAMDLPGDAEGALLKALEVDPGNTRAALKLGWSLLDGGRPDRAEHAFRTALAGDASLLEAWVGLVRSLDTLGREPEAENLIRRLALTDPELSGQVRQSRENGPAKPERR